MPGFSFIFDGRLLIIRVINNERLSSLAAEIIIRINPVRSKHYTVTVPQINPSFVIFFMTN